ncbi:MAG: polysaccharide deacetylase family protein [Pirellulales bacterium]|nr:polysaccharide deacetylase family protein [Pirellulales bacterium]
MIRDAYGAVVRGDPAHPRLALVFTGDEFGESAGPILDALDKRKIAGSFFLTGRFLRDPKFAPAVKRMAAGGHYVGPHSDGHLLYCDWDERERSLVTRDEFVADLQRNLAELRRAGACPPGRPVHFIPPFEWYNREQVEWCRAGSVAGAWGEATPLVLANFTPGTGSQRDYAREDDPRFVPARTIYDDILAYESRAQQGLNGHLLLLHLGSGRRDPFHPLAGRLCDELVNRGYEFARIDVLLGDASQGE